MTSNLQNPQKLNIQIQNVWFAFFQKKGSKDKKMVTFKEPSLAPDLSSHTLVNHADVESEKYLALDTLPDSELELEIKIITVRQISTVNTVLPANMAPPNYGTLVFLRI